MSKLKGKKKLNKAVSAQLAQFGIKDAKLSTEYSYMGEKERVTYKLTETIEDEIFNAFVFDRFGYKVENTFIFSLLHEVGHHLANDEIKGAICEFCNNEKDRIEKAMQTAETENEIKEIEYQYFNLPDEIMATQWAVNYARQNPLEVGVMWACIKQELEKFYTKNGLLGAE